MSIANPKGWNEETVVKQFIERVKIYKLLIRIRELKQADSYGERQGVELPQLEESITLAINAIDKNDFAELSPIIVKNASLTFLQYLHGENTNIQEKFWDELLGIPVQPVSHLMMMQSHKPEGLIAQPYIKDGRMYVSVDINGNRKVLEESFSQLLVDNNIPRNEGNSKQITATHKQIIQLAFIPLLDHRIKAICDGEADDDELALMKSLLKYRFQESSPDTSALLRAAKDSIELLDKWLTNTTILQKLQNRSRQ